MVIYRGAHYDIIIIIIRFEQWNRSMDTCIKITLMLLYLSQSIKITFVLYILRRLYIASTYYVLHTQSDWDVFSAKEVIFFYIFLCCCCLFFLKYVSADFSIWKFQNKIVQNFKGLRMCGKRYRIRVQTR